MVKEHTVYFKVIRGKETKLLTGLIFLEEDTEPTLQDFEECLKQCGHDMHVIDKENFIFQSNNPNENYTIDVLEHYKPNNKDYMADNLAQSFMKKNPIL